jgi:hypothetical protein
MSTKMQRKNEKNARKASAERKLKIAEAVVVAGAKLSAF